MNISITFPWGGGGVLTQALEHFSVETEISYSQGDFDFFFQLPFEWVKYRSLVESFCLPGAWFALIKMP